MLVVPNPVPTIVNTPFLTGEAYFGIKVTIFAGITG
jgi:hypothetical protein